MELDLPPVPEYVSTARLFASESARHFGIEEGPIADLKIAISEACTGAIGAVEAGAGGRVHVKIDASGESFVVEIASENGFRGWSDKHEAPGKNLDTATSIAADLSRSVVTALFPDAQLRAGPGTTQTLRLAIAAQ